MNKRAAKNLIITASLIFWIGLASAIVAQGRSVGDMPAVYASFGAAAAGLALWLAGKFAHWNASD